MVSAAGLASAGAGAQEASQLPIRPRDQQLNTGYSAPYDMLSAKPQGIEQGTMW